ncbi:MAG: Nif3-like dinuclear metal center hexameric protein [Clostridiales Family XIII bacterium]|jgi:dinuclear metal center YbgI/SA1388 family protein|nr:Nif3-like dinuclear metal center hexameric protein [Clostridiales Family XIII bacterium]
MSVPVNELIGAIEEKFPLHLQENWDSSGWQIALPPVEGGVSRILVALEITREIIAEAKDLGAELIVEHHPLMFGKLANIDATASAPGPEGAYIAALIESGISVYAAHTTFDTADGGMNDALASALGLTGVKGFPSAAGAGALGLPDGAEDGDGGKWIHPIGRKGSLPAPVSFGVMAREAAGIFGMEGRLKTIGDPEATVRTVALCGGAGGDFVTDAIKEGVDLYITSDVKHHEAQWAREKGLMLIDGGHWGTEKIFVPEMAKFLREKFGDSVEIRESRANQDPWR